MSIYSVIRVCSSGEGDVLFCACDALFGEGDVLFCDGDALC